MQSNDPSKRTSETDPQARARRAVIAYPFVLLFVALVVNWFVFREVSVVFPLVLPDSATLFALVASVFLLLLNHGWLMTITELTRVRFGLKATPEEWLASGRDPRQVSEEARLALERCHNAHRNATENVVYFAMAAPVFVLAAPSTIAAWVWLFGFAAARLLYTGSYIAANTGLRGMAMSLALLCLCGLVSYPAVGLLAALSGIAH